MVPAAICRRRSLSAKKRERSARRSGATASRCTPVTAPLNRVDAAVRRGDTVRVDVVVRTRKVGHFFPGGTVDAFDMWVELQADGRQGAGDFLERRGRRRRQGAGREGRALLQVAADGRHGNPINKRNAWSTRSVVYVRLIPPGAADTVHYRLQIPETRRRQDHAEGEAVLPQVPVVQHAVRLRRRARSAASRPRCTPDFDDRPFIFTADTSTVSGKVKQIPDLPIVVVSPRRGVAARAAKGAPAPEPKVGARKPEDWTRWNDYGIGFLLQGDLKDAQAAFTSVTEIDPKNPDGWVNIGRVRVQEGDVDGAREVLERALAAGAGPGARQLLLCARLEGGGQARGVGRVPAEGASRNIRRIASSATIWGATCSCCGGTARRSSSSRRRWRSIPRTCRRTTT